MEIQGSFDEDAADLECVQCSFVTSSRAGFEQHMTESHGMMRDFRCDLCDYSSIFMSKLEWHKKHSHAEKIREPAVQS